MTTTKALWAKRYTITSWRAKPIMNPNGRKMPCINGCGNQVSAKIMTCRSCLRKAKIVQGRREEQRRKAGTR